MFGGNGGGRTRHQTKVHLNLYDLSPANDCLYPLGFGLHHSGIEILGSEYSFASGGGIFESSPGEAPGARFRERIDLGSFDGNSAELKSVLDNLRGNGFGADDYHLIKKNCNHFANALVWSLLRKPIPPHVNRLADVANCFVWLLPKKLLEDSPVGPNGRGGGGGGESSANSGYQVFGGSRANRKVGASAPTAAFIGRGARLGGAGGGDASEGEVASNGSGGLFGFGVGGGIRNTSNRSSTTTDGGNKKDELTHRREKARQAALARMERSNASISSGGK